MSSCKATLRRFVSASTTRIHVVDGISGKKHDEEELAISQRFQVCIKKATFHEERNDTMIQEGN